MNLNRLFYVGFASLLAFATTVVCVAADAAPERLAEPSFPEISRADVEKAFESLRPSPRLLPTDAAVEDVRRKIDADPRWKAYCDAIKRRADVDLTRAPVERKLTGIRLLGVSREALRRVFDWTFVYRLTGDAKYAARVETELVAISEFSDWNPSHFLDVAEMSVAVAIGYDACKATFSPENRAKIAEALATKGLQEALAVKGWWKRNNANWNQVCWCGTLYAALALADDDRDAAIEGVWRAVNGVTWSMSAYEPDGNYAEGPVYWGYGTGFNILLVGALNSALNNDFGRSDANGFLKSILYFENVVGTTGEPFNYPDAGAGKLFEAPAFWYSAKLNDPNVVWNENNAIDAAYLLLTKDVKKGERAFDSLAGDRLAVCALLWGPTKDAANLDALAPQCDKEQTSLQRSFANDEPKELGYVGNGDGRCRVALFRTAWAPDAAYLGIKAGRPDSPHGHLDEGSFVYDDAGARWICELGPEPYDRIESRGMNLWDMRQSSDRWKLLRYNNFGHSVPTLNGALQLVDGRTTFTETKIGAPDEASFAVLDLTPVYRNDAAKVVRRATLNPDGSLTIQDEIEALADKELAVERRFATTASVETTGPNAATLKIGDSTKAVETTSDVANSFAVVPCESPNEFDSKNPGVSILLETAKLAPGQKAVFTTTFAPTKRADR